MSFRIENKYELVSKNLNIFYKFLSSQKGDILFKNRLINSIYFDNQSLSAHINSEEGIVPRKKIRLRYYGVNKINELDIVNFEEKFSTYEGKYKKSTNIKLNHKLLNNGLFDNFYGLCKPIVEIQYLREYYSIKDFRITIDKNIKYRKYNSNSYFDDLNSCIFEVKYNKHNFLINEIDELFPFKKTRFSKYSNAINFLKININSN